ncbi:MAG TPA: flagellar basal body-associated FliL family protein [Desulfobacteraceae bacterium]|nr:flagellar basal body-associated FliL family protein [Desulfobacteraceae bacterium]
MSNRLQRGKNSGFIRKAGTLFIAALFIAGSWLSWKYRDELRVPLAHFKKAWDNAYPKGQVRCSVASTVDGNHYLRMKLAIPCEDRKQQLQLSRNLPRFKNQFLMKMSEPEVREAVKNRDFETIRHHIIKILNNISKKPVKSVYFEGFLYD